MELKDTIELMQSADYKDRFRAEHAQAQIRLRNLGAMLAKWEEGTLEFEPTCPKNLLYAQLAYMHAYLSVLEKRAGIEGIQLYGLDTAA